MKKGLCILFIAIGLALCACGNSTEKTSSISDVFVAGQNTQDLFSSCNEKCPEVCDESTVSMCHAFADHFEEAADCEDIKDLPEEFLISACYFYNFGKDSPEHEIGEYVWTGVDCLERGEIPNFQYAMGKAKQSFKHESGMSF